MKNNKAFIAVTETFKIIGGLILGLIYLHLMMAAVIIIVLVIFQLAVWLFTN